MKNPLLLLLIGLIFTSCGKSKKNHTEVLEDNNSLAVEIDSLFNSYYNDDGPAAAIFISYNGKEIIKKTYGLRNVNNGEKATNNTNFNAGSMTKQFTAIGILKLQDEGKLKITDTVYRYFSYPIFKNVTIEQLISHTSGIADADRIVRHSWNSSDLMSINDVMDWYKNNDITKFSPGTQFSYNNGAYCVLVKLIEDISGKPFSAYMNEVVFDRIGMKNTYFVSEKNFGKIPNMAVSYERDSLSNWVSNDPYDFSNALVGPTGLYSNLNDYSKYLKALRQYQILSETSHELIFKPVSMDIELHSDNMQRLKDKESFYSMGWEVTDSLAVSAGAGFGINNWSIFKFKRPLSLVIFTNNDILFKENLVDKTYNIIDRYVKN
ncbi:serine hydrolase [Mangrovivirga sp. M17]|uniref:Serine hydrolase n=1 Tax=Mangrovivirga halotolerans TaxID=2993936 RepID=A0ABT3RVJ1_9BACT|nr:serine hydrolase domain-containing protein [Mangrovivirga halotolerans]MCX2745638.1 serine hydrolase [Mangrovivirga halotolerans]